MAKSAKDLIIIITGPSGVGKGTIVNSLLSDSSLMIARVIRHMSRSPRLGEIDGETNYFVSIKKFLELIDEGIFLEWNRNGDYFYGTTQESYKNALAKSRRVVFDIGVPSALHLEKVFKSQNVKTLIIFLSPIEKELLSSKEGISAATEVLKGRICRRSDLEIKDISDRLQEGKESLVKVCLFDNIVTCKEDRLQEAIIAIKRIILNRDKI